MRQIFLDTETTGLYADGGDRVIEVGCVEMFNRKLTGNNLHFYLNPGRDSHEDALKVHGITTEFLRGKPTFEAVVGELLTYLQGAEVIIHNAAFDVGFLNTELKRAGHAPFATYVAGIVDTLAMAKEMYPGKRNSLNALCDRLDVDRSGRTLHGALLDAELLAEVYINLTRGQDALLMEVPSQESPGIVVERVDLNGYTLPVLSANEIEQAAHVEVVRQLEKSSGGKILWKSVT